MKREQAGESCRRQRAKKGYVRNGQRKDKPKERFERVSQEELGHERPGRISS